MYFKDKTEVYKIRLTPEQSAFIDSLAKVMNCSKSEIVRKVIDSYRLRGRQDENK